MEAYSLSEVNEYIKRVVALNFQEPLWIECEISQIKEVKGQVYVDLIEKSEDSDQVIAQISAVIWFKEFLFVKKKLGSLADSILQNGVKVKIKATVDFHERYGIKLVIADIDPSYSLGMFELARQKIIDRLQKADLINKNHETAIPTVIQRIAIISSSKAAGYKDFVDQLITNNYGYQFHCELFSASMQGQNTERDVLAALDVIIDRIEDFDVVLITRGGGSKIDLSSFDNYNIAHAVANLPIPVLTGIGHEIDETVTDIVAHTVLKTPTALANYIIDHNMYFESECLIIEKEIGRLSQNILHELNFSLKDIQTDLFQLPMKHLYSKKNELESLNSEINTTVQIYLKEMKSNLKNIEEKLELMSPKEILKKGYAYITQGQKTITHSKSLNNKEELEINFQDGKVKTRVVK